MAVWEPFFRHLSRSHNFPTSNSATQHSDIYRGNSTLTLFEPDCPWISYREGFVLPDAKFVRLHETAVLLGFRAYFPPTLDIKQTVSTCNIRPKIST